MRRLATTSFRFFIIAIAAVCLAPASFADCPAEVEAINRGDITPNGPAIAAQCPEACPNWVPGTYMFTAWDTSYLDFVMVQCSDARRTKAKIFAEPNSQSNASTCWNCVGGCAGSNCPPGELCVPIPRQTGSDCQRFGCPAGYSIRERSAIVNGEERTQPYCVLTDPSSCPPDPPEPPAIIVTLEGPSTIRTGTTCSWSASAIGGATGVNKTYTWYVSNNPVGYGPYYTGGRPSGTLVGYGWRLRVDATDGVRYGSKEIVVSESSSAPICAN
jgi:hypothetical protein